MFEPSRIPRVFGLPPGVDFPKALVSGLILKHAGMPPEALARVDLVVNTRRMARRIRDLFDAGPPLLLPRIRLVTDLGDTMDLASIPPAVSPLRRRLELVQLIGFLLDQQPDLAPRTSLYDLADSLADLMDEMHGEGVSPDAIEALDVSDQSGHWERAKTFIGIAKRFFEVSDEAPDKEARQRLVITGLAKLWQTNPPQNPIIIAGSTGSRGATMLLMQAVARLPQGALVLPGYDFDLPDAVWSNLDDPLKSEDHPQFRFRKLMHQLEINPADVKNWAPAAKPASPSRGQLVSLSLRPAPVTDAWLTEGPQLPDLNDATKGLSLIEARDPRDEALAIATRLRQAVEDKQTAALITPDRMLSRRVAAALDRWDVIPDDSAGQPLQLSPPGRFLRHVAQLFTQKLTSELLLTLLKHPLCHSGGARNEHVLLSRELELHLRRYGPPYPDTKSILEWGVAHSHVLAVPWAEWVAGNLTDRQISESRDLTDWVNLHRTLAEQLSAGSAPEKPGELWLKNAGQEALKTVEDLEQHAPYGGEMTARDYTDLVGALLSKGEVRDRDENTPGIMIWGTLEARVQGADLLILGGLNEGSWPEPPTPDPWLNRTMRNNARLLLPERRIGLSAHDYQQAIAAKEVWLTRAVRSDDAETVASRWINRLTNLLNGLPEQGGRDCLNDMRRRGHIWLQRARVLEAVDSIDPAPRPSPRPPVVARPNSLSVTEIKRLIRDPYAIYAKHVLRLKPLDPLVRTPDAPLRGTLIHDILERFIRQSQDNPALLTKAALLDIAHSTLKEQAPWPAARVMWLARIERVADWFLKNEAKRQSIAKPIAFEQQAHGRLTIPDLNFTLRGYADRIDRDAAGDVHLYDYKSGRPPSQPEQKAFDKQLLIEAAMLEQGGFKEVGPATVTRAVFIGLGSSPVEIDAPLLEEPTEKVWVELKQLIAAYQDPEQGYTSRRSVQKDTDKGDYDQLARFGEWDNTFDPMPEDLT
ncbi:MAG: double-strand break repair protein AddB [Paracoccaceae bacterium]